MIFLGAVFDFLDGFAARALKVKSEIGKQLDSLADLATFGILPALIMYQLTADITNGWEMYIPLVIALAAAVRLAKFNIDSRQTNYFIGLPTPAMALMCASLPFIRMEEHATGTFNIVTLLGLSLVLAFLMISRIKLIAFKFTHFKWNGNEARYILILLFLILVFYFSFLSIPIVLVLYLIFSLFAKYPESGPNHQI